MRAVFLLFWQEIQYAVRLLHQKKRCTGIQALPLFNGLHMPPPQPPSQLPVRSDFGPLHIPEVRIK